MPEPRFSKPALLLGVIFFLSPAFPEPLSARKTEARAGAYKSLKGKYHLTFKTVNNSSCSRTFSVTKHAGMLSLSVDKSGRAAFEMTIRSRIISRSRGRVGRKRWVGPPGYCLWRGKAVSSDKAWLLTLGPPPAPAGSASSCSPDNAGYGKEARGGYSRTFTLKCGIVKRTVRRLARRAGKSRSLGHEERIVIPLLACRTSAKTPRYINLLRHQGVLLLSRRKALRLEVWEEYDLIGFDKPVTRLTIGP